MKLREIRQDKGLSRSQLAKEASLNYITIWQIENGKATTPHLRTVGLICDALEVSPNEVSEFSFIKYPEAFKIVRQACEHLGITLDAMCVEVMISRPRLPHGSGVM